MTEREYKLFKDQWERYKRATKITGEILIDELWCTMEPELYTLVFGQGDTDALTTEELVMQRIKDLHVVVQHAAVHTVNLHSAAQEEGESTMAFATKVRGIASNCNLTKRSKCECEVEVSYLEETCYHIVLAGLKDQDLQECCTAEALLKNIKDLSSLVQFYAAEESGLLNNKRRVIRL